MPKAYGYLRVSTGQQADAGNGMDAQGDSIRRHFEYKLKGAFEWGGTFEDPATSGNTPFGQRTGGVKLMSHLEEGDVVVVAKLDRAFRNVRDCLNTLHKWDEAGVKAYFLDLSLDTATAIGRLFLQIVAAFAEWERNRISERTREGLAAKRARGRPTNGSRPYGRKHTGVKGKRCFTPDHQTRALGKKIVEFIEAGWVADRIYIHFLEQRVLHRNKEVSVDKIRRYYIAEKQLQQLEAAEEARKQFHRDLTFGKKEDGNGNEQS